jgi:predicted ATPase
MFLEAFRRRRGARVDDAYPWTVPALRNLREVRFAAPVTFLMGENGCGKSTLLEALAVAVQADAAGAEEVEADATLPHPEA